MADQSHETGPRMRVLLTGADPGIPELVSRWQSTTVTVDGKLVQLRLIHVKPEGKGSFRSNSVMFRYVDVVVVLEPVEMQLMCTRRPGAAYISSGDIGGLKAKHFLGPEASDLASDAGLPLILVASAAHLRGQKREIHMGETHKEEFEAAANALGAATYLELSAETGQGVQELLQTAARLGLEGKWRRELRAKVKEARGTMLERRCSRDRFGSVSQLSRSGRFFAFFSRKPSREENGFPGRMPSASLPASPQSENRPQLQVSASLPSSPLSVKRAQLKAAGSEPHNAGACAAAAAHAEHGQRAAREAALRGELPGRLQSASPPGYPQKKASPPSVKRAQLKADVEKGWAETMSRMGGCLVR